jgi:hypothetical protein
MVAYPPPYPVYPQPYPPRARGAGSDQAFSRIREEVPAARLWGRYADIGAGATAVLVPTLLAATAALLAVGMAALALAICALVIRWIIRDMRRS